MTTSRAATSVRLSGNTVAMLFVTCAGYGYLLFGVPLPFELAGPERRMLWGLELPLSIMSTPLLFGIERLSKSPRKYTDAGAAVAVSMGIGAGAAARFFLPRITMDLEDTVASTISYALGLSWQHWACASAISLCAGMNYATVAPGRGLHVGHAATVAMLIAASAVGTTAGPWLGLTIAAIVTCAIVAVSRCIPPR